MCLKITEKVKNKGAIIKQTMMKRITTVRLNLHRDQPTQKLNENIS